jgi:hypothetical protein
MAWIAIKSCLVRLVVGTSSSRRVMPLSSTDRAIPCRVAPFIGSAAVVTTGLGRWACVSIDLTSQMQMQGEKTAAPNLSVGGYEVIMQPQ